MGGELKNRKRITASVNIQYAAVLDELSEITRIPKSKLLDEALNDLFLKHQNALIDAYTSNMVNEIMDQKKSLKKRG